MTSNAQLCQDELHVNGLRSPYLAAGPVDSPETIVFIHGNPGSSRDWITLLPQAGQYSRAVAFDLPGFGQADKPDDFDYSVPGYTRHLEATFAELGIGRAHLVLHDFGGAFGLAWAAMHPSRVASLSLINIGVLPGYRWHYLARIWRAPMLGELFMRLTTRSMFRLLLRHGNRRGLPTGFVDRMYRDFDPGTQRAVLRLYRSIDNPDSLSSIWSDALEQLQCPALVLWGAHDPYVPVGFAFKQRAVFPDADIVVLQDSGHWPFADNPEQVANTLLPFLQRACKSQPGAMWMRRS